MTKTEAYRNLVLNDLGWLGKYTYENLPITDQLYIDQKVEELERYDTKYQLLTETLNSLS